MEKMIATASRRVTMMQANNKKATSFVLPQSSPGSDITGCSSGHLLQRVHGHVIAITCQAPVCRGYPTARGCLRNGRIGERNK